MNPTKHVANVKLLLLVKLFAFFKEQLFYAVYSLSDK